MPIKLRHYRNFYGRRAGAEASHEYPPETPGIEGILYAWGAGIARGRAVTAIRAVDIHPTVAHLLGIASGSPVDGTVVSGLLAP